jgi:hypothetical protein
VSGTSLRRLVVAALVAVLVGLGGGLALSWGVWPTEYYDAQPADLRAELRQDELLLVSESYSVHEDLDQARRRLAWLGLQDDDAARALTDLVDYHTRSGADVTVSRSLSKLAYALGARDKQVLVFIITPTPTIRPTPVETPTMKPASPTASLPEPTTPSPSPTRQAPPTATGTATTSPMRFVMDGKRFECRTVQGLDGAHGLLVVRVKDETGRAVPGVPMFVSWGVDEDKFFTGLKRQDGLDYADFEMQPGSEYVLYVNDRTSQPVRVSFRDEDCSTGVVTGTAPVWELTFEQRRVSASSVSR